MGVVHETASANGTSMKVPRNAILALILEGCIHTALANAEILADRLDVELYLPDTSISKIVNGLHTFQSATDLNIITDEIFFLSKANADHLWPMILELRSKLEVLSTGKKQFAAEKRKLMAAARKEQAAAERRQRMEAEEETQRQETEIVRQDGCMGQRRSKRSLTLTSLDSAPEPANPSVGGSSHEVSGLMISSRIELPSILVINEIQLWITLHPFVDFALRLFIKTVISKSLFFPNRTIFPMEPIYFIHYSPQALYICFIS
ncbi:uncharacterized protein STEHIDRAFT_158064 [Stereum hirsutum FP-91666 SS1]|uniref:uncharacterized protein n=1 Tax=Stereum hirsutum (strain FP-91666) TaxID=721885 RepID=UPI0004449592|nr:uncharacterized protein STEHIDRAFT_158064 [Stereum hirsutum FP-91666 SS1]EIM85427.1 hypothetical protein STEHIDRAFT_158064 [Stereum hirsutum FP-91666 SS1]